MSIGIPKQNRAVDKRAKAKTKEREWQTVRRAVLARDKGQCRACRARDQVEVHHIRFRSLGGGHTTANCACLCRVCHGEIHAYRLAISGSADGKLKIERAG